MIRKSLPALLLLSSFPVYSQEIDLSVKGLSGELEKNVDAYLSSIPAEEYNTSLRFQARLEKSLTEALNALGYYHPDFSFQIVHEDSELIVTVTPGEPVTIKEVDIQITGEASDDRSFKALIRKSGLKEGQILNHSQYDGLKSGIRNLALQKGYFEGDFTASRLEVAPDLNQAFILSLIHI